MSTVSIVTLEDGLHYVVIDNIVFENKNYIYLTNVNNESDFCIRKLVDRNQLIGLRDSHEFDLALTLFNQKHANA